MNVFSIGESVPNPELFFTLSVSIKDQRMRKISMSGSNIQKIETETGEVKSSKIKRLERNLERAGEAEWDLWRAFEEEMMRVC